MDEGELLIERVYLTSEEVSHLTKSIPVSREPLSVKFGGEGMYLEWEPERPLQPWFVLELEKFRGARLERPAPATDPTRELLARIVFNYDALLRTEGATWLLGDGGTQAREWVGNRLGSLIEEARPLAEPARLQALGRISRPRSNPKGTE